MRILILGAGGIGGFYGARLLNAGRDVTFLVRPQRAALLAAHGLQVVGFSGDVLRLPPPPVVLAGQIASPYDLILLSCKAYDLASSIAAIAPAVGPESSILPLLNGMAHMATLDERFGRERVLGGTTNVSASLDVEGRILHLNQLHSLQFGHRDQPAGPQVMRVAETLSGAGFAANLVPAIVQEMWNKWVAISSIAGFTCLMRAAVGDFVAAGAAPLYLRYLDECLGVAAAEGYPVSAEYHAWLIQKFTQADSPFTTSMLRDLELGNAIEAHQIIGGLLERATRHPLETPMLALVHANLRCYEERRARVLGNA